jgi:hypothetical protein
MELADPGFVVEHNRNVGIHHIWLVFRPRRFCGIMASTHRPSGLRAFWREVWLSKYFGSGHFCRSSLPCFLWSFHPASYPCLRHTWNCEVTRFRVRAENKPSRPLPPTAKANPQSPPLPLPSDHNLSLGNAPQQSKPPRPNLPGPGAPGLANGSAPTRPMSLHSQGTSADSSACEGARSHWPRE